MESRDPEVSTGPGKFFAGIQAKGGVLSIVDQGLVSAAAFLTMAIIGRLCSREDFGYFALNYSIVLFLTGLQTSLISVPFMVRSPGLHGKAYSRYMSSTLLHQAVLSGIFVLLFSLVWYALSLARYERGFLPVFGALTLMLAFILFKEYIRQLCYAKLQIGKALKFDAISGFMQLGGLLLLGQYGLLSPVNAFWVMGIACGSVSLSWLIANRGTLTFQPSRALRDFLDYWNQGRWILVSGIAWSLGANSYSWILAFFWGAAMVGTWSACMGIASLANPLFMGIQNFLSPRIAHFYARSGIRGLTRFIFGISAVFTTSMLFFLLFLVVFGEDMLTMVYSQKYSGHGEIISALGLNFAIVAIGFSSSRALFVMSRTDIDCMINLMSLFILLAIGLFLVKTFGLMGAACALILSSITSSSLKCVSFTLLARGVTREVSDGKWSSSPQD